MNCPYCNEEMECGVIQSQHELKWRKHRHIFISQHNMDVQLSARNIWKGSAVKAYACPDCKKIIIDYAEECDLNKKPKEQSISDD